MLYIELTEEQKNKFFELHPNIARNKNHISRIFICESTGRLRFINRDNMRILQQECKIKVDYSHYVSHGGCDVYWNDYGDLWIDVPLVEE